MEEPYNTAILVTLVICEDMDTPATKVQSSLSLLGSFFVSILRSPLGIIEVVDSLLSTGDEEWSALGVRTEWWILEKKSGDLRLIAA